MAAAAPPILLDALGFELESQLGKAYVRPPLHNQSTCSTARAACSRTGFISMLGVSCLRVASGLCAWKLGTEPGSTCAPGGSAHPPAHGP